MVCSGTQKLAVVSPRDNNTASYEKVSNASTVEKCCLNGLISFKTSLLLMINSIDHTSAETPTKSLSVTCINQTNSEGGSKLKHT